MTKVGAIFLDTRSIQKYVFASNKLKTNAGASYLVDSIFSDLMENHVLDRSKMPPEHWRDADTVQIFDPKNAECEYEVIYIGGGNMFILVNAVPHKNDDAAILKACRNIVSRWSRIMLQYLPGIKTGAAVDVLNLECDVNDKIALSKELSRQLSEKIYKQLKDNQNAILPQVDIPYTGLTLECDTSGKTATLKTDANGKYRWISAETAAKMKAFRFATEKLNKKYADIISVEGNIKYEFASELDKMGAKDGESYICVIHIDGNNMGVKFGSCEGLQERKDLSIKVGSIVEDGFRKLLSGIVAEYDTYGDYLDMEKLYDDEHGCDILPIRPIIIGGDDVTFVCPGRLGLTYAKRFIEAVNGYDLLEKAQYGRMKEKNKKAAINRSMSCCGGIAIVPAKYPFFRAYELAEQLCSIAKKKSRETDNSLIDFAILHGDMYSSIESLRQDQYQGVEGGLHYGPYSIIDSTDDKSHINDLFALMQKLNKAPKNKVKKLREVLTQDEHAIARYLELSDDLMKILGEESSGADSMAKAFWQAKKGEGDLKTRYIDAIEIMDFMPKIKSAESSKEGE